MNRSVLKVAAELDETYIAYDPKTDKWSGLFVTRLLAVCGAVQVRCEIYIPQKNESAPNELSTGVMGDVYSGVADLGLTAMGITAERFLSFDIFYSYMGRSYSAFIHENNLVAVQTTSLMLSVFSVLASHVVWAIILLFMVLFFVLGVTFDKVFSSGKISAHLCQTCADWATRLVGTGLGCQGIDDYGESARFEALSSSKLCLYLTWQVYTLVLLSVLVSRLPVIFTFGSYEQLPFSTPKGLVDSNFSIYSTATPIKILSASLSKQERDLGNKIAYLPKYTGNATEYDLQLLQLARNGRNAIILNPEFGYLKEMATLSCSLVTAVDRVVTVPIASIIFAKNSALTEVFRKGYTFWTECGIGENDERNRKFLKSATSQKTKGRRSYDCPFRKINDEPEIQSHSISIRRFSTIFMLMGAAFLLGVMVLCMEIGYKYENGRPL